MSEAKPDEGGFTLIEALVAAAVLAMISVLLAPALLGAINAASRSQSFTDQIEERAALESVIHELFASAHAHSENDAMARFTGNARSASLLVRPRAGAVQRARLDLAGQALTLRLESIEEENGPQSDQPVSVTLAEGFEAGALSYIGVDRTRWQRVDRSTWSEDNPPRLVVVRLDWPDGSQTRIQALVSGQGRFDCRFDSGRGLCLGDTY